MYTILCYNGIHSLSYMRQHSFCYCFSSTQLVSFVTSIIPICTDQCIYICTFPLLYFPLLTPLFYLLGPSSCDRNRPPRSQVVCKLLPFVPLAPSCPPFQNPNPFSDFPEPNVHLIKARLNPLLSIQNTFNMEKKHMNIAFIGWQCHPPGPPRDRFSGTLLIRSVNILSLILTKQTSLWQNQQWVCSSPRGSWLLHTGQYKQLE